LWIKAGRPTAVYRESDQSSEPSRRTASLFGFFDFNQVPEHGGEHRQQLPGVLEMGNALPTMPTVASITLATFPSSIRSSAAISIKRP
jgi:hypothetical protein